MVYGFARAWALQLLGGIPVCEDASVLLGHSPILAHGEVHKEGLIRYRLDLLVNVHVPQHICIWVFQRLDFGVGSQLGVSVSLRLTVGLSVHPSV